MEAAAERVRRALADAELRGGDLPDDVDLRGCCASGRIEAEALALPIPTATPSIHFA